MTTKPLSCVIVGLGRIGWQFHLPQILDNPNFNLAGVVDVDPNRLQEAKERFNLNGWTSLEDMPDGTCDLVILTSPTQLHCPQAVACFKRGMDVFCDKPVALNADEARTMGQAAQACGRKLMVYQPYRISTETKTAQAIIASGKLGNIYRIRKCCHNFQRRNDWQAIRQFGGGMLMNYGAHFIDQLLFLGKQPPVDSHCTMQKILSAGDCEDVVSLTMKGDRGMVYDLSINMADALPAFTPSMIIYGDMGTAVSGPKLNDDWTLRYCRKEELPQLTLDRQLEAKGRKYPSEILPWHEENVPVIKEDLSEYYCHVYDYFSQNLPPLVPFQETLRVMDIISQCQQAYRIN